MDIGNFLTELERIERTGSANSRSRAFAQRARQAVVNAYVLYEYDNEYHIRKQVSADEIARADKLVAMGVVEAVYGRGRALLHK